MDALQPAGQLFGRDSGHIRNCHLIGGHDCSQREGCLATWFSPTWNEAPRVGIFELGEESPLLSLSRVVVEVKKTSAVGIDLAAIGDRQCVLSAANGAWKGQRGGFFRRIEGDIRLSCSRDRC